MSRTHGPTRLRSTSLAGTVAAAIVIATFGAPARLASGRPFEPANADHPACVLYHRKAITPTVLNVGQTTTVTLAVRPQCRAASDTVRDLTVTDALTGSVALVPGSAQPPANSQERRGVTLTWRAETVPAAGLTFSYQIRTLLRGHWPTSARTVATYADEAGRPSRVQLDETRLVVRTPGQAGPGMCWIDAMRGAIPERAILGLELPIQLVVRARCTQPSHPRRAIFALDAGRTAEGPGGLDAERAAIAEAVLQLRPRQPRVRFGVVGFGAAAWTACEPTDDPAEVTRCLAAITPSDGHDVAAGIREGVDVFGRNQRLGPPPAESRDVLLVYGTAPVASSCPPAIAAADAAKEAGALVATVCGGGSCPDACLSAMASSRRYAFTLAHHAEVVTMLDKFSSHDLTSLVPTGQIEELLSPDVDLIAGSPVPEPSANAGRHLIWRADYVPAHGMTITYTVRLTSLGEVRPVEAVTATVTNHLGSTWLRPPLPIIHVVPAVTRLFLPALRRGG